MAVQAQYPSNVLFLNRNAQEGIGLDCTLQPQPGGGGGGGGGRFLDHQTHMLFSNGEGAATRKRGRESLAAITAAPATAGNNIASSGHMIGNPFTLQQPQPLQLIELSQLHCNPCPPQSTGVSTGLHLSSTDQQKHRHTVVRQTDNRVSSPLLPDDFAAHVRRQRDEIDQFLRAQGEQLRRTLAEKRHRHYRSLLTAAEATLARKLREKDAEVEKAARRNAELEARAAQLGMESQVWQAKARAQEAAAASLQAQLQQAIIVGGNERASPEDCTGGSEAEDAESAYVDPERMVVGPGCRGCRRRAAAVVLLPCRHLCVCTDCDRVARSCPVCFASKESSVEVFLP